eukprot:c8351_g1_i1 orf=492-704(+)
MDLSHASEVSIFMESNSSVLIFMEFCLVILEYLVTHKKCSTVSVFGKEGLSLLISLCTNRHCEFLRRRCC